MTTVRCPNCAHTFSTLLGACPSCGESSLSGTSFREPGVVPVEPEPGGRHLEEPGGYRLPDGEPWRRDAPRESLRGIGGWLILPALGLVFGSLVAVFVIVENLRLLSSAEGAAVMAQFPEFKGLLLRETALTVAFTVFQLVVAVLFFQRKRIVPVLMIALFVANLVLSLFVFAWVSTLPRGYALGDDARRAASADIFRSVAGAAIWIPYFLISRRVKATFTE